MSIITLDTHHHHPSSRSWVFHPYEFAVVGYKNSGKTTLLEKIAAQLSKKWELAFRKHDAHHFDLDHPGKDTYRLQQAGCVMATISGEHGQGVLQRNARTDLLSPYDTLEADALLVEGYKEANLPRMVLLDGTLAILEDTTWSSGSPMAVAHPFFSGSRAESEARARVNELFGPLPWFSRDEVSPISDFIEQYWLNCIPPLHGIVLAGGKSARMGSDKAWLDYHGKPQLDHAVDLLSTLCKQVYVSCRPEQVAQRGTHSLLTDRFLDCGPAGGILTALATQAACLVLACDLPQVDLLLLEELIRRRNPFRFATAYADDQGLPEPLCTIWEPKSYGRLLQFMGIGTACPRKCLIQSPIECLPQANHRKLENSNTPEDFQRVSHDLKSHRPSSH
jgi:molybdopterin-guanine dinucleotide biosynthesis protein MobB